jgi:quinol monooxygenase YgiN
VAFVVIATWRVQPGKERLVEDVLRRLTPLSRAEDGCLFYQAQVCPEDPQTFVIYEQYVDESGYLAHKASPHFTDLVLRELLPHLDERIVQTYETIGGSPGPSPAERVDLAAREDAAPW